ncbi:hypothetical protein EVAR_41230_1 [Eumeta japonica]|uniref:Uncharacterized protein n=1 Tax=Eumeta variegata TaxID=151549 RepID=A0A4C1W5X4_EUMVA|nr:hypothetical protein EVAR_41230_1 [Eumeta japonica]
MRALSITHQRLANTTPSVQSTLLLPVNVFVCRKSPPDHPYRMKLTGRGRPESKGMVRDLKYLKLPIRGSGCHVKTFLSALKVRKLFSETFPRIPRLVDVWSEYVSSQYFGCGAGAGAAISSFLQSGRAGGVAKGMLLTGHL